MRWKRTAPWMAVVTAGVAAVAILPGLSWGSEQPPGGADGFAAGDAAAANTPLVGDVARDLRIDAAQAGNRLRKDNWAGRTEAQLRRELGAEFGGAWVSANGGTLNIGVTTDAAAAKVTAAGATPKKVARSEQALAGIKTKLDTTGADRSVTGWYVEASTNTIVITAKSSGQAKARALIAASGVPADAVKVVANESTPKPLADIRGGEAYFINQQFRCSVGFSVQGGFVTAGHCGEPGDTTAGAGNVPQGTVRQSTFPGTGDFGFVQTNATFTPTPFVATSNAGLAPVAGSQEAPVGAAICRTGSTTGTRCGTVLAKNQTVNYPEGAVTGLTRTNVCAEGGDSGGSWLSGTQAQGVTSGGSGDCTRGGETFFQPVGEILQVNNLTLVTTGDNGGGNPSPGPSPAPSSPAPAPSGSTPPGGGGGGGQGCTGMDASASGSLSRAGAQQIVPNGRFFRARGGKQEGCLSGPEDANFDLVLQRWNGRRWQTVASSTGPGAEESLTFNGSSGFYRYGVVSVSGSGIFVLGANLP
jgi:streptogrisin C